MMSRFSLLVMALASVAMAQAQSYNPISPIRSAIKDQSNLSLSLTNYAALVSRVASDPDLYINSGVLTTGTGWDPGITMFNRADSGFLGSYQLGSLISGNGFTSLDLAGVASLSSGVATGIYNFTYDLIGGTTSTSTDLLATFNLSVDVRENFLHNYQLNFTQPQIQAGQTSSATSTMTNLLNETIYVNGLWFGNDAGTTPTVMTVNFDSNYFFGAVSAGQVINSVHSNHTALASTPLGTYGFRAGFYGGYYEGDEHWGQAQNTPTLEVVPEPATMTLLAAATIAAIAKRRKS